MRWLVERVGTRRLNSQVLRTGFQLRMDHLAPLRNPSGSVRLRCLPLSTCSPVPRTYFGP